MASRVGRGGQSGEPLNHSHAGPAPRQSATYLGTCPAAWIERDELGVGDTTAYKQEAAGYPRLRSTEDGRRPSAYLLSQPTYNSRVLRSSWATTAHTCSPPHEYE